MRKPNFILPKLPKKFENVPFRYPKKTAELPDVFTDRLIDVEQLERQRLQWFNMEDIYKFSGDVGEAIRERCWLNIVNLKKNTGKSTWLLNQLNDLTLREVTRFEKEPEGESNFKFILMYRYDVHMKQMKNMIKSNNAWLKFKLWGDEIYFNAPDEEYEDKNGELKTRKSSLRIHVGTIMAYSNIANHSSKPWNGYYKVFWDEYRPKSKLSKNEQAEDVTKFITFISNFQRNKDWSKLKFYLFGNNERGADHIAESFGVSKKTDYYVNIDDGILYVNANWWKADKKSTNLATRFAERFNPDMDEFLNSNTSLDNQNKVLDRFDRPQGLMMWGYLYYDKQYFKIEITMEGLFFISKIFYQAWRDKEDTKSTITFRTEDYLDNKNFRIVKPKFIKGFALKYKLDMLFFDAEATEEVFTPIFTNLLNRDFFTKKKK